MYRIQPFIWQKLLDDQIVFQTQNSTVVIRNKDLSDFLIALEKENKQEISRQVSETVCGTNADKITDFLVNQKILIPEIKQEININKILVFSNDAKFIDSMSYNIGDLYEIVIVNKKELEAYQTVITDMLIVFLNPFKFDYLVEIYKIVREKDIICKFIFSYNNRIYFSNYHRKTWYNPCPLCFFYSIESTLRGEDNGEVSFQTIIDLFYAKNIRFEINLPLTQSAYLHIVYLLTKYLLNTSDTYLIDEVAELNLQDGSVRKDIAYHWGYCDCYE